MRIGAGLDQYRLLLEPQLALLGMRRDRHPGLTTGDRRGAQNDTFIVGHPAKIRGHLDDTGLHARVADPFLDLAHEHLGKIRRRILPHAGGDLELRAPLGRIAERFAEEPRGQYDLHARRLGDSTASLASRPRSAGHGSTKLVTPQALSSSIRSTQIASISR